MEAELFAPTDLLDGIADPVRLGLVRCLAEAEEATVAELIERCQASGRTVRRHLEALAAGGIVVETPGASDGATPGRPSARFSLHPEAKGSLARLFRARAAAKENLHPPAPRL